MLPINSALANRASFGKIQLWAELERKVNELGLTVTVDDLFLLYAPSDGTGDGKVYGGCAGPNAAGAWYVVLAYGPIGAAPVKSAKAYSTAAAGRSALRRKYNEKLGRYQANWPGDRPGLTLKRCTCGTAYADDTRARSTTHA